MRIFILCLANYLNLKYKTTCVIKYYQYNEVVIIILFMESRQQMIEQKKSSFIGQ